MSLNRRSAYARLLTALLVCTAGCAGGTAAPAPAPAPGSGGTSAGSSTATQTVASTWPVLNREHLDMWLHGYAMLAPDTTLVPYFRRGYRDRMTELRRQRGVSTELDANRATLLARLAVNPSLATSGQFLPLYFASWEQMRQAIDLFIRAGGNPGAANDPNLRVYLSILGGAFPSAADREWLRVFSTSVDDESRRFYHDHWVSEQRARASVAARADSLWQRQWRPALQRFLNNTQQQNGELYLSIPLGGEGRTIHFGKAQNAIAVTMPESQADAAQVLYVLAHEVSGAVAAAAIEDNTTPADRRAGVTSRYDQAAAVRAGALLLERTIPAAVPGYMRYYLQVAGRAAPTDPRAAFATVYALPETVREALVRQFEVILGGI